MVQKFIIVSLPPNPDSSSARGSAQSPLSCTYFQRFPDILWLHKCAQARANILFPPTNGSTAYLLFCILFPT